MPEIALVVDASLARAAGYRAESISGLCRTFLNDARRMGFRLAMTDALKREWNNHQSAFAAAWRASMQRRNRILHLGHVPTGKLDNRIQALEIPERHKKAMKKDSLLIVAAHAAHRVVVSQDDEARKLFEQHAETLRAADIIWRHPEREPLPWN